MMKKIFFTDNIVAGGQASLEKWLNNPAVLPDQIFIENGLEKMSLVYTRHGIWYTFSINVIKFLEV